MGLAARNPLLDDANDRAVAATLQHLADTLVGTCTALKDQDGEDAAARLDRNRVALGYVTRAWETLIGVTRDELPPTDPTRPRKLHGPAYDLPGAPFGRDHRLPPGRPHP